MRIPEGGPSDHSNPSARRSATPGASAYSASNGPSQWDHPVASQVSDFGLDSFIDEDGYSSIGADEKQLENEEEWEDEKASPPRRATGVANTSAKPISSRRRRGQSGVPTPKSRVVLPRTPRGQHVYRDTVRESRPAIPVYSSPLADPQALPPVPVATLPSVPHDSFDTRLPGLAGDRIPWEDIPRHLLSSFKATILYAFGVLKPAVRMMKYPLTFIVFLLLLAFTLKSVAGIFKSAFAPFCFIPGINMMNVCQWINHPEQIIDSAKSKGPIQWADYPALVELESKTFDQLLDESMGLTSALSLDLKKTEVACSDLIALVRLSDITSKESLANTLSEFLQDAKVTGRGLSRLSAKFNGALDNIMAVNDYALRTVEKARNNEDRSIGQKVNDLMPWSPPRKDTDMVIKETFAGAMDMLGTQLARLIVEAEVSHRDLDKLEETLTTLHAIVQRENSTVTIEKDDLLANLWTKLGWNQKELRSFNRNLAMLKELASYRKQALAHVVTAIHTLQQMNQEMDDIRERVAAPALAGLRIAPEVHMKSIQIGLERLKESRLRARKIEEEATRKALGLDYGSEKRIKSR